MDRRTFFLRLTQTALVGAGFGAAAAFTFDARYPVRRRGTKGKALRRFTTPVAAGTPRAVVARGKDPVANVRAALDKLGGIRAFIQRGDRVLLKPNAAFDRTPELAANTSPEVVAEVIRQCRDAGAKEIVITDVTLFDAERCWESSGLGKVARSLGVRVLMPKERDFVETRIDGVIIETWPALKALFAVDKVINLPTVKHHRLARVTLGMKNWLGAIGGQRHRLHQKLDQSIVDFAKAIQPTLTILDGSRLLMDHGPTGGSLGDVKRGDTVIAGWDQVAVDRLALPLLGADVAEVPHLTAAARNGLGRIRLEPSEWAEIVTG